MAKAKQSRKLDPRDADSLDTLLEGRGWQLVRVRLDHELKVQMADLEQPKTEIETAAIRGKIGMLRLAISMPERLYQEATKGQAPEE